MRDLPSLPPQMYTVHFALRLLAPSDSLTLPGWFLQRTPSELASARAAGLLEVSTLSREVVSTLADLGLPRHVGQCAVCQPQ